MAATSRKHATSNGIALCPVLSHMLPSIRPLLITPSQSAALATEFDGGDRPNQFNSLSTEMIWEIALLLDSDQDLSHFQQSCSHINAAVKNERFWRVRFNSQFDHPRPGSFIKDNAHFEDQYKKRSEILRHKPVFVMGRREREKQFLAVLKDMMLDSYSGQKGAKRVSKNIESHIGRLHLDPECNILERIFDVHYNSPHPRKGDTHIPFPNPLMRMLQVLLAPNLLDPRPYGPGNEPCISDFQLSQHMAYATAEQKPIFTGCHGIEIDFTWVLHQINFWRCHMLSSTESTLNQAYRSFPDADLPPFWSSPLSNAGAASIGKHWKGAYGFIDERDVAVMRAGRGQHAHIQDEFSGEETQGGFQDLTLESTADSEHVWPPLFETVLHSLATPQPTSTARMRTRAQKASSAPAQEGYQPQSFRFGGKGEDSEERFLADGWINSLPAQMGVPGWQRMTMMKYFIDEETSAIDYEALWAYEGVVLPGGRIILGRWWSPTNLIDEQPYSGPFLLWCVDDGDWAAEE